MRPREGQIDVALSNEIVINSKQATLRQRMEFDIQHVKLSQLHLRAPQGSERYRDLLRVELDGKEVTPSWIESSDTPTEVAEEAGEKIESDCLIPLAVPQTGPVIVTSRLELPLPSTADTPQNINLPCLMPIDATPSRVTLRVQTTDNLVATLATPGEWATPPENGGGETGAVKFWQAKSPPAELQLTVSRAAENRSQPAMVERAYLQSWLSATQRQDRAVFTLTAVGSTVRCQLPPGCAADQLIALWDGKLVRTRRNKNSITIDAPEFSSRQQVHLELAYPMPRPVQPGSLRLVAPEIDGATWTRKLYWQIILPEREHVVLGPENLQAEHRWQRNGLIWRRVPVKSQAELEAWSSATTQTPPSISANVYLFSGFGRCPEIDLTIASRRALLLYGSGALFGIGLIWRLLLAWPLRWYLVTLSIIFVALAWLVPAALLVLLQATSMGILLIVVARLADIFSNGRFRGSKPDALSSVLSSRRAVAVPLSPESESESRLPSSAASAIAVPSGEH